MAVSRINHDGIGTGIHQSLHTVEGINGHTDTSSHTQTTFLVFTSHGLILGLGDVLIGDQTDETVVLVDHRQFLDLVLLQNLGSSDQVGLLMGGHEVLLRHDLLNGTIETTLETEVAVGDDTHKVVVIVNHGNTTDMIFRHDVEGLSHGRTLGDGDRIVDHTVLGTLYDSNLTGLVVDRHILMNNTDTTLAGDGNSHLTLGNSIHSCCHERNIQFDVARKAGFQLYRLRQHF